MREAGKLLKPPAHLRVCAITASRENNAVTRSDKLAGTQDDPGHPPVIDREPPHVLVSEDCHAAVENRPEELANQAQTLASHVLPIALLNESRIPARVTFLKPLSAAVSIGTGGPFGAEGPIIATGGALGSLVGQLLHMTPSERKTLLAAGAAAGMAATFGSPVSAVLLAIELLLFEFRPRSIVPGEKLCGRSA